MRAPIRLTVVLVVAGALGCGKRCRDATLLVSLNTPVAPMAGDSFLVTVTVDGQTGMNTFMTTSTSPSGTVEISLSPYPTNKTVTVAIAQQRGGVTLAAGVGAPTLLSGACPTLSVALTGTGGDGGLPRCISDQTRFDNCILGP